VHRRSFLAGFAVAAVLASAGVYWLETNPVHTEILFPQKRFLHSRAAPGQGYVAFAGAIAGENIGRPNNYLGGQCDEQSMRCTLVDFGEIGPRHIGEPNLETWPVVSWTPSLIVVRSNPPAPGCTHVTLNVLPAREEVQYIRETHNPTGPNCEHIENRVFRWHLDDPPGWRRINGRRE